jgi:hypothetical protein
VLLIAKGKKHDSVLVQQLLDHIICHHTFLGVFKPLPFMHLKALTDTNQIEQINNKDLKNMTTTNQINQDDINKAVWNACDTFRGVISADTYKDFILTMLFLKYISDVYKD